MDYIFENTSVQELAGKADLCVSDAISTEVILWAKTRKRAEMHDPFLGAMAVCGSNTVVKHLPPRDYVHLTILAIKAPGVAALWDLPDALQKRYEDQTGQTPFSSPNMTYEDWRLAHRSLSLHAAAQIRNGDFDLVMPPLPQAQGAGGKSKFSELVPDLEEATATETDFGAIQAQETLGLTKVVPVLYPPLARIAHIQGDVTLQLSIDQLGRVTETKATTGHPILKAAALDAAAHWFFAFPYTGPNPLAVTIHFEMHCPAMIDTASTHSRKAVHKKRKPPKRNPTR
jgi:TonB family protein